jgi:hypothetical protein
LLNDFTTTSVDVFDVKLNAVPLFQSVCRVARILSHVPIRAVWKTSSTLFNKTSSVKLFPSLTTFYKLNLFIVSFI